MTFAAVPLAGSDRASFRQRGLALALDVLPLLVITPVTVIPIAGERVYLLLAALWWLMRDARGASLGKRILGLRVETLNGGSVTLRQAAVRNATLAAPLALALIPVAGLVLAPGIGAFLCLGEIASLALTGKRIGDKLAGSVVRRG